MEGFVVSLGAQMGSLKSINSEAISFQAVSVPCSGVTTQGAITPPARNDGHTETESLHERGDPHEYNV